MKNWTKKMWMKMKEKNLKKSCEGGLQLQEKLENNLIDEEERTQLKVKERPLAILSCR